MKWEAIHPRLGSVYIGNADYLVKYAEDNGMNVVGHTLVWHSQTPDWVFTDENGNDLSREDS